MRKAVPLLVVAIAIAAVPAKASTSARVSLRGQPVVAFVPQVMSGVNGFDVVFRTSKALPRGPSFVGSSYIHNLASVLIDGVGSTSVPSFPSVTAVGAKSRHCWAAEIHDWSGLDGFHFPANLQNPTSGQKVAVSILVSSQSAMSATSVPLGRWAESFSGLKSALKRLGC